MNKKVLTVVLVVLLAMTSVFAYSGEMKVGLNLGSGVDGYGQSVGESSADATLYSGFYASGVFQYGLTDSLSVKAEVGLNTFSQFVRSTTGKDASTTKTDSRTANVIVSAAVVYDLPIGKLFAIDLQLGADAIMGKPSLGSEKFNISMGMSLGSALVLNFNEQIALNINSKVALYFANSNKAYREALAKTTTVLIGVQNNIGVTYSL